MRAVRCLLGSYTAAGGANYLGATMDETPQVGTAATAGRIGMIAGAIAAFIALFSAHVFDIYSRVDVIAVFGVTAAAGCAIAGIVSPRRTFDAIALAAGAGVAGFLMPLWAEQYSSSTMAMLAWVLLVASAAGLAIGLSTGRAAVDPRAAAAMAGAAERMRQAAASPAMPADSSHRGGSGEGAAAPGWYPDAENDQLRWWDGRAWTDDVRPLP